jgi:GTP1/Obg family GTP-binding protein
MGEWGGGPRKQIVKQIMDIFRKDPDIVPKHFTRPKLGVSGIQKKPEYSMVTKIDDNARILKDINEVKKNAFQKIGYAKGQIKFLKEFGKDSTKGLRNVWAEGIKTFKRVLDEANKTRDRTKEASKRIITDVGGSGEVRRQRKLFQETLERVQQKRPFDN